MRFVFDTNRCTGCHACIIACSIENNLTFDSSFRQVVTFNDRHSPQIPVSHLSIACNHCGDPPCLQNCPTGAYSKDSHTGAVTIDPDICIGCKYCTLNCPYDAPRFNPQKGYTEKCNFCNDRQLEGKDPACVMLCPTNALQVEAYDPEQKTSTPVSVPGFTETDTEPAFHGISWTPPDRCVSITQEHDPLFIGDFYASLPTVETPKISLRSEWPLIIFTSVTALLVAFISAMVFSGMILHPLLFFGIGVFNLGLATIHLGKKFEAHRAIQNIKNSWLSREILLYGLFLLASFPVFIFPAQMFPYDIIALLVGILLLISIDGIYLAVPQGKKHWFGGADIIFSAFIYGCLLQQLFWISLILSCIRTVCFVQQSQTVFPELYRLRPAVIFGKALTGIAGPVAALILVDGGNIVWIMLICIFISELIQRAWFYLTMDIHMPANQVSRDFTTTLANSNHSYNTSDRLEA